MSAPHNVDPAELSVSREAVAALCEAFPGTYWREKDRNSAYPTEFVDTLTDAG